MSPGREPPAGGDFAVLRKCGGSNRDAPARGRNHLRANAHVGHALRSHHLRRRGRLGVRDAIAEEQSLLVHANRADTRDHGIG